MTWNHNMPKYFYGLKPLWPFHHLFTLQTTECLLYLQRKHVNQFPVFRFLSQPAPTEPVCVDPFCRKLLLKYTKTNLVFQPPTIKKVLTLELANGQKIPNVNTPSKGPPKTPVMVAVACFKKHTSTALPQKHNMVLVTPAPDPQW